VKSREAQKRREAQKPFGEHRSRGSPAQEVKREKGKEGEDTHRQPKKKGNEADDITIKENAFKLAEDGESNQREKDCLFNAR
jgi:hypothetical protein